MYKCGWNGCEKAYGTLNHLNAHVTMQGHGPKRTPDGMISLPYHPSCCTICSTRHPSSGLAGLVNLRNPAQVARAAVVGLGVANFGAGIED